MMLFLRFLGGASLHGNQSTFTGPATQRHRLALLALLAISRSRPQSRDKLVAWLWPERDVEHARNLLNQGVHALRKAIGEAAIVSTHDELRLDPAAVECDVVAFEDALAAGELERAIGLYTGPFLDGFHLPGASEFEHWADGERDRLRRSYARSLESLAEAGEAQGKWSSAVERWRDLASEEPYNARVTLRLMRALEAAGDRAGALQEARLHTALLQQEFEAEPDPGVVALAERLRTEPASGDDRKVAARPPDTWLDGGLPPAGASVRARAGAATSYPLIGRHAEWELLLAAWDATRDGSSRFALIAGEAGIGKTRMAEELLHWAGKEGITAARTRSYAAEGRLAYAPVADWLRSPALRPGLDGLEPAWLTEVVRLLPELRDDYPHLDAPEPMSDNWQRQRLFTGLARAVLARAGSLILLIDDLQWCDKDTLQWLHFLMRDDAAVRLLVVGTVRSEDVSVDHPLSSLLLGLGRDDRLTEITLGPLNGEETADLASEVAGQALEADTATRLYRESEGVPLFVVESVRARSLDRDRLAVSNQSMMSSSAGPLRNDRTPLPPRVQAVIQSRLSQLSPGAHTLAGVAAAMGGDFTLALLARACDTDEGALVGSLEELWQRRIIREHGGGYDFSHDKLREVAYDEIGPMRRRLLHQRAAEALQLVHASDVDAVSGQIASHYERGGLPDHAIPFHQRAAEVANRIYAYEEAIGHLNQALVLLGTLPECVERDRRELALQIALGPPLRESRGFAAPEIGDMAARAWILAERVGTQPERMRARWELVLFRVVRGTGFREALETAEEALQLALAQKKPSLLAPAYHWVGVIRCQMGEFLRARESLEQAAELYDRRDHATHTRLFGFDYGVLSPSFVSHVLWHLGYADQALARSRQALDLAEEHALPFSRAVALAYDAMLHQFCGTRDVVEEQAAAAIAISTEYGFPYYLAWGTILHGWAVAERGQVERGIAQMREGLTAIGATGCGLRRSYYLSLLAQVCGHAGQVDEGLDLLQEALTTAEASGERWKDAELHRLEGELWWAKGHELEAEASFRRAVDVASRQQATMLGLRAASGLAAILRMQGKQSEGRQALEPIFDSFTEGFDTPDLKRAEELLVAPWSPDTAAPPRLS